MRLELSAFTAARDGDFVSSSTLDALAASLSGYLLTGSCCLKGQVASALGRRRVDQEL